MTGNSYGKIFRISSFGESHGKAIGVVIDGCPSGLPLDGKDIQKELDRRKPGQSKVTTARKEGDKAEILSGTFRGVTTGAPIAVIVYNKSFDSSKYDGIKNLFRPGHADYTYFEKYGLRDHRGGGRSSARETIARVAAGAIAKKILATEGIRITGHVVEIAGIVADKFNPATIEKNPVRCADSQAAKGMEKIILEAKKHGDSLGGVVEVIAKGVPVGLGEPVFDKLDAELAKAVVSVPAVKGVEFGEGYGLVHMLGSEANDEPYVKRGKAAFRTNNAGGINGGISNGSDIVLRAVIKPTPSISKEQNTVDTKGKARKIKIKGMHDPCICPRAVPVLESMVALTLLDMLLLQRARD